LADSFTEAGLVTINILFGAYDDNPNYQGHQDVVDMFEITRTALWQAQIIDGTIGLRAPFDFEVQEDYFPHFFGLLTTTWALPTPDYFFTTTDKTYE
jgi:hypothetical protein